MLMREAPMRVAAKLFVNLYLNFAFECSLGTFLASTFLSKRTEKLQ